MAVPETEHHDLSLESKNEMFTDGEDLMSLTLFELMFARNQKSGPSRLAHAIALVTGPT